MATLIQYYVRFKCAKKCLENWKICAVNITPLRMYANINLSEF